MFFFNILEAFSNYKELYQNTIFMRLLLMYSQVTLLVSTFAFDFFKAVSVVKNK